MKPRVIYLSPKYTQPYLAMKYAAALAEGGADVKVFGTRDNAVNYDSGVVNSTVPFSVFPPSWYLPFVWRNKSLEFLRRPYPSLRLLTRLLREPADIYIAGQPDDLPLAAVLARMWRGRLIYMPFEYYPGLSYGDAHMLRRFSALEARYAKRVDAWVSLGDKLSELYERTYGIAGKVYTVYSSVPRVVDRRPRGLRAMVNAGKDTVLVIYTGQISRSRGVWQLLEAITEVPENVIFVTIGGKDTAEFRGDVVAAGLQRRIHVFDPVRQNELMGYTAEADIGLVPIANVCESYYYCNPGKLFEFIAAGLPLAVSNLAQLGWYVRTKGLGEIFEPDEPSGIPRAVTRLATNPVYRNACAAKVRRIHEEEVCWEIQAEKLRSAVLT